MLTQAMEYYTTFYPQKRSIRRGVPKSQMQYFCRLKLFGEASK